MGLFNCPPSLQYNDMKCRLRFENICTAAGFSRTAQHWLISLRQLRPKRRSEASQRSKPPQMWSSPSSCSEFAWETFWLATAMREPHNSDPYHTPKFLQSCCRSQHARAVTVVPQHASLTKSPGFINLHTSCNNYNFALFCSCHSIVWSPHQKAVSYKLPLLLADQDLCPFHSSILGDWRECDSSHYNRH